MTTVAVRIAEEMQCRLGEEVGYSIRFEDATSAKTRIKLMTDGILLREALIDPLLSRYSVIMVDEAHERSLSTDVLLGILRKISRRRPELRIIISSATLQAESFLKFFAGDELSSSTGQATEAPIGRVVSIEGRAYPVDILYLDQPAEDYLESAVKTVFDIHARENDGDILLFLTGREEIDTALQMIADRSLDLPNGSPALMPLPLYAGLSSEEQMLVFDVAPESTRKVIVSTNIAEASVTVDGVVYVVDCGFAKLRAYDPDSGVEILTSVPVSKASATQRTGRAGRTKPGKCFRLYTEDDFLGFADTTPPEIQRSNLAPVILQLKALGIDNIARFSFMSPPPSKLMTKSFELLYSLGALDDYAKLTKPLGMQMAELSVEPMMAKVLLSAPAFGCLQEVLTIAAMTSLQGSIWVERDLSKQDRETSRHKFAVEEGDHITLLNVYSAFVSRGRKDAKWCRERHLNYKLLLKAVSIRAQLGRYLERFKLKEAATNSSSLADEGPSARAARIRKCLTAGYFAHAAKMQPDGTFLTVNGALTLHAHPSSLMFVSSLVLSHGLSLTTT